MLTPHGWTFLSEEESDTIWTFHVHQKWKHIRVKMALHKHMYSLHVESDKHVVGLHRYAKSAV